MPQYAALFPEQPPKFPAVTYVSDNGDAFYDADIRAQRLRDDEVRARAADWAPPPGYGYHVVDPVTAALRRELRRYRYKPSVQMTINPPPPFEQRGMRFRPAGPGDWMGTPLLTLVSRVPDSRAQDVPTVPWDRRPVEPRLIEVRVSHGVPEPVVDEDFRWPPEQRQEYFRRFLRDTLWSFEDHEMREWFRFDGKLIDDPHKLKGPTS